MWIFEAKTLLILSATFCMFRRLEGRNTAMGCFKDKGGARAMPELLHSFRKNGLNWGNLGETVIDNCQKLAEEKNYKCFGIQFYGECWSGKDACNSYQIHGKAGNCFCSGDNYKPYVSEKRCREPVGGKFSNFVYQIEG